MLKAVIFDMDGVIIDSEPMHARAAILALKKYNVDITMDYLLKFIGSTTFHMCEIMIKDFHIDATPEELWKANDDMKQYLLRKEGHIVIPYITNLMKDLQEHGIKMIIASSSPSTAIEEVMNTLQIRKYFDGYVSGAMVDHPKPAPDIFLLAAARLNVAPAECLVIEDSYHGITAASSAGITSVGFVNPNSGDQDLSKAAMLIEGFDEVDYGFLNHVYQYSHQEPVTILTTEHFIIRELSVEDIDVLYLICQPSKIKKYLDGFDDLSEEKEKHQAYIKNIYHYYGYGLWGVFAKDNNRLVGRCGIEYKQLDGEFIYEIGYLLDLPHQGKGFAREFVTKVVEYGFLKLNMDRIVAIIEKTNVPSINLAEQIGMIKIGECRRNQRDCYKYEIKNTITKLV